MDQGDDDVTEVPGQLGPLKCRRIPRNSFGIGGERRQVVSDLPSETVAYYVHPDIEVDTNEAVTIRHLKRRYLNAVVLRAVWKLTRTSKDLSRAIERLFRQ